MKSGGGPIQHEGQIRALIRAMMGPRELAIIKCQAHKKGADSITQGNTKADKAAKEASGCIEATIAPVEIARPHPGPGTGDIEPQITLEDVAQLQEETSVAEKAMWKDRGALQGQQDRIWRNGEGLVIAPTSLLTVLISEAHGVDHCARGEVARKIKKEGFWSPYLQNSIDSILSQCEVCAQNNIRKGITAPIGHIPIPEGPFKHLCMDYVDMGKVVRGKRYMLVIIDRFSRWIEATPSKDQGSGTVINFLSKEIIPRFGIPTQLSSDNGSAFIGRALRETLSALRIKQKFGCVYHPQSQGMVERANGTLKAKISKICNETGKNWIDALPLALMQYRSQENRITHLSPHEMMTGRVMPVPKIRGSGGPTLECLDQSTKEYIQQLTVIHRTIFEQEKAKEEENPVTEHQIKPGDRVYIRKFRRRWNEPRREGPFEVTKVSPTALQVEGSTLWYHLNHCTRTVPGVGERREIEEVHRVDRGDSEEEIEIHGENRGEEEQSQGRTKRIEDDESSSVHELADDTNAQPEPISQGAEGGEDREGAPFPTWELETISLRNFRDP
ncbi:protein NYNRIN-like [Mustelus asterias]